MSPKQVRLALGLIAQWCVNPGKAEVRIFRPWLSVPTISPSAAEFLLVPLRSSQRCPCTKALHAGALSYCCCYTVKISTLLLPFESLCSDCRDTISCIWILSGQLAQQYILCVSDRPEQQTAGSLWTFLGPFRAFLWLVRLIWTPAVVCRYFLRP